MERPPDESLTFVVSMRFDFDRALTMLARLRLIYPNAKVVVRSDGDPDPRIRRLTQDVGCEVIFGEHLYPVEKRGAIVSAILELGTRHQAAYLFKIDTDTRFDRQFTALPEIESCVFGTLQASGVEGQVSLQGGCVGLTRLAALKLLESGVLTAPELDDPFATWAFGAASIHRATVLRLASFDWILAWACSRLGIPMLDWPEIRSAWQRPPDNFDLNAAVIHPNR